MSLRIKNPDNIERIISLSNCEWIQSRWKISTGDWCVDSVGGLHCVKLKIHPLNKKDKYVLETLKTYTWLPIGFNIKTGNWQVDDLLMKILKLTKIQTWYLIAAFDVWRRKKYAIDAKITIPVLKLMWLKELIEKEEK